MSELKADGKRQDNEIRLEAWEAGTNLAGTSLSSPSPEEGTRSTVPMHPTRAAVHHIRDKR